MKSVKAPPKASVLVESMRDVGYSLDTALADIIDNSISAGATRISIDVEADGDGARLTIMDDGTSMTPTELIDAMRLGSRHPRHERLTQDLGRFGLGLKTASLSQCRRLTVIARKGGKAAAAIWDLDEIARSDDWILQTAESEDDLPLMKQLENDGVLVIWEKIDRALESTGSESARKHFLHLVDDARKHLELVFHRYLAGEPGLRKVEIFLNELPLKPFDPFNSAHPATMRGQSEKVGTGKQRVEITPFTLPHHRNVTQTDWNHYAGEGGYLKNQGFYLYRERRLILHGTWFGLARPSELTKLARIRIDITNAMDEAWLVDVKKAYARPPLVVRERLQRLVGELGAPSRRVFTHRGRRLHSSKISMWQRILKDNDITYSLNKEAPPIDQFTARLPRELKAPFEELLKSISAGLPMDALFADLAGSPDQIKAEFLEEETLMTLVAATVRALRATSADLDTVLDMCRSAEPFRSNWERSEALLTKCFSETHE
jgi:hypothetical protein